MKLFSFLISKPKKKKKRIKETKWILSSKCIHHLLWPNLALGMERNSWSADLRGLDEKCDDARERKIFK